MDNATCNNITPLLQLFLNGNNKIIKLWISCFGKYIIKYLESIKLFIVKKYTN